MLLGGSESESKRRCASCPVLILLSALAVSLRDPRCVMVNYDRQTLKQTPEVLREIAQNRQSCAGVYGSALRRGVVQLGDPVFLD